MTPILLGARRKDLVAASATGCSPGRSMLTGMKERIPRRSLFIVHNVIAASPEGTPPSLALALEKLY